MWHIFAFSLWILCLVWQDRKILSSILFILVEEAEYHGSWQHLSREDIDQFRLNCRGVRATGAANKKMVLTLPARGNFNIIARVRHITAYENCVWNTPGEVTTLSP
jgi:hypothetical protein